MDFFLGLLFNAILLGCTYTLVAIGFSLFFGVMDIVVFCCGDIAIFGTFAIMGAYAVLVSMGAFAALPFYFCVLILIVIGALFCAALSLLAYKVSVKPFAKSSALIPLLSTIALGTIIKESIGLTFKPVVNTASAALGGADAVMVVSGKNPQGFPQLITAGGSVEMRNLIIIATTVLLLTLLFAFLNKSKPGLTMQAISQNKELSQMAGLNISKSVTLTFIIGGVLLSVGGFLIGNYQTIMSYYDGAMFGAKGFSAAVVGGLRNTWGAVIGGMLLAFVEVFVAGYLPGGTAYAGIIAFVVVVLFIIFKPEGIIGDKSVEKV